MILYFSTWLNILIKERQHGFLVCNSASSRERMNTTLTLSVNVTAVARPFGDGQTYAIGIWKKDEHDKTDKRLKKKKIKTTKHKTQNTKHKTQGTSRPERLYWVLVLGLQYSCVLGFPNTCSLFCYFSNTIQYYTIL